MGFRELHNMQKEREAAWKDGLHKELRYCPDHWKEEDTRRWIEYNLTRRHKLAKLYIEKGNTRAAFQQALFALDIINRSGKEPIFLRGGTKHAQEPGGRKKPTDLESIAKAVDYTFYGRLKEASDTLGNFLHKEDNPVGMELLRNELRDAIGGIVSSQLDYCRVFSKLYNTEFTTCHTNESRNRVGAVHFPTLPFITVYDKEYEEPQSQTNEWNNSILFRAVLGGCIQGHLLDDYNGSSNCFMSAGKKNLYDKLQTVTELEKMRMLKDAAALLARIHILGTKTYERGIPPEVPLEEIKLEDIVGKDKDYFTHKIKQTLMRYDETTLFSNTRVRERMMEAYSPINDALVNSDRDYYKDHNPRNIVIDSFGSVNAIDFESSILAPCQIDLVSLLEFGSDYTAESQRLEVIEKYIQEKEQILRTSVDRKEFLTTYRYARVQKHLEIVGYMSRDSFDAPEDRKRQYRRIASYHLNAALSSIGTLLESESRAENKVKIKEVFDLISLMQKWHLELGSH